MSAKRKPRPGRSVSEPVRPASGGQANKLDELEGRKGATWYEDLGGVVSVLDEGTPAAGSRIAEPDEEPAGDPDKAPAPAESPEPDGTGRDVEMYSLLFTDAQGENLIDVSLLVAECELEFFTKRLVRLGMLMTRAAVCHVGRTFGLTARDLETADMAKL